MNVRQNIDCKKNKLRWLIGYLADKFKYKIVAFGTTVFALANHPSPANAQLLGQAKNAMNCIVTAAKASDSSNLLSQLPTIIFTGLTLIIFGYFLYTIATVISETSRGNDISQVVQQPLITFICIVLMMVFQSMMFGKGEGCDN